MLSAPKVSQLAMALEVAGYTDKDIDIFVAGDMPTRVLDFIRKGSPSANTELNNLTNGDQLIKDVFTPELTEELGYSKALRTRVLSVLRSNPHEKRLIPSDKYPPFNSIGELTSLSRRQLRRIPRLSTGGVRYIVDILAHLGIVIHDR